MSEFLEKGNIAFQEKDYEKALEYYKKANQIKEDAIIYYNIGVALTEMKNYAQAIENFDRAIKLNPNNKKFYTAKGYALYNLGRYVEASESYNLALKVREEKQKEEVKIEKKEEKKEENKKEETEEDWEEKRQKREYEIVFEDDKAAEEKKQFEEPTTLSQSGLRAIIEDKDRKISELEDELRILKKEKSDIEEHWSKKGNEFIKMKDFDTALKCYDKILEINPNSFKALGNKAIVLVELDKKEEAIECFDSALKIKEDEKIYYNKGLTLVLLKRYTEAIECFEKAIKLNKEFMQAYNSKGNVFIEIFKFADAVNIFEIALKIKELDYLWYNKARAEALMKNPNAIISLKKAIAINKELKEMAKRERDFENIVVLKEFEELVFEN